jgi:VanZ family protein
MTSWPRLDLAALADGGDKLAHLGGYAILGALSARAAYPSPRPIRTGLAILVTVLVIGLLDEVHQSWIPGRATDIADWLADGVGGCIGILVAPFLPSPAHRRRESTS